MSEESFTLFSDSSTEQRNVECKFPATTNLNLPVELARDVRQEEYQPRTLGTHNIARLSILPVFPTLPSFTPTATTTSQMADLLLANVPSEIYFKNRIQLFPLFFIVQSVY